ncbi:MAG: glycosyltransferase family 2 protein [Leadbetterella sp.]|nr:glycosyltransferase family 2 protein [Leadbetterella sp.]
MVIPVYNEEENIPLLIDAVSKTMDGYNYELILVDDASTDQTRKAIRTAAHPRTVLIELKKNYGQSSALMSGIDYASADYIITLDGDLQNDPSDIPMMVDLLEEGDYDLVIGRRAKRKDNLLRTFPSRVANFIIRYTTRLNVKDHGCALKVFRKETAKGLQLYGESHRFVTLISHIQGARIAEVPVKHHPRQFGVSKYGINRTFKVINDLLLLLFTQKYLQKPIYLFGNIGLLAFISGVGINVYLLILKLMGNEIGGRPLLILGVLLLFTGIQLFTTGILMDLQMKTYYESQGKRPFEIRKIVTF